MSATVRAQTGMTPANSAAAAEACRLSPCGIAGRQAVESPAPSGALTGGVLVARGVFGALVAAAQAGDVARLLVGPCLGTAERIW